MSIQRADQRVPAGIVAVLGFFFGFGFLGIHKFMLGYHREGWTMLLITVCTCFIAYPVMLIISLIEGIIYLTKSEEAFYREYVVGRKGWF
ncbi:MAG: TM2 domain-containing protein [Fimbriimonas sp.]